MNPKTLTAVRPADFPAILFFWLVWWFYECQTLTA